jgi:PAS domain S-box-containing protein
MFGSVGLPHGVCFLWNPGLLWLHVVSDSLIALAYFLIPVALVRVVRKRSDLRFNAVFLCFAAFIVACGVTHVMEVVTLWHPIYWVSGAMKAATAAISIATLVVLVRITPVVLKIPYELADRRFRELIEDAPDAILQVDASGTILIANRTAERVFGYSREELLGGNVDLLVPIDLRSGHRKHRNAFLQAGVARSMGGGMGDLYGRRKDGTEVCVEIALSPSKTEGGTRVTAVIRDVTERKLAEKKLDDANRLADRKFRELIEDAPDAIVQVDETGNILLANKTAEEMFGYSRRELLGSNVDLLVPMGNRGAHPHHRDGFMLSGTTRAMGKGMGDLHARRKDGGEISVEIALSRATDAAGTRVTAVIRDVTERKRADLELESTNERLNSVLESTKVGIYAVDRAWTFRYINDNAKRTLRHMGDVLGRNLWELFPDLAPDASARLREAMESRAPAVFESYYEPLDLWTNVKVHPWREAGITVYFSDISDRKRAERELEQTHQRLASVLDNTSVGVYAVDREWKFTYVNENAKALLKEMGNVMGKDLRSVFPDQQASTREKLEQVMTTRQPVAFESYYRTLDLSTNVSAHPLDDGGITIYFTDISAQRRLERELEEERAQRQQRIEVLARLSSGLAHEIKNPLAIIHARASDLQELAEEGEVERSEIAKTCTSIVQTSDRAIRILRGVAAMARVGTHDPMQPADVAAMVRQTVELVEGRYKVAGVRLDTAVPEGLPPLECREVQISQILVNLLNNAIDAVEGDTRSERWVRVAVSVQPGTEHENHIDRMQISVVDGGPGVAPEHKERLMQTFFTTKSMGAGIGIGLSVSRTIAEDHGGQLELRESDKHTCFRLTLPIKACQNEEVAA